MCKKIANSTSKIINKIKIKKNRIEKDFRLLSLGSKPHSNGLLVSRLKVNNFRFCQKIHTKTSKKNKHIKEKNLK